jgi:hypothetical protein
VGDPGLEPGTSSYRRDCASPPVPPNPQIIPANCRDGAGGRGLEGTGGDKLVAPWWPHGRHSRAWCGVARKRSSCRRYGQARTLRRGSLRPSRSCAPAAIFDAPSGSWRRACERPGARHSAQRLPCRLGGIACLSASMAAGLRRSRCRRGRSLGKPAVEGVAGDSGGAADVAGQWELAGTDRAQHRRHIEPVRTAPRPPPLSTVPPPAAAPARRCTPPARQDRRPAGPVGRQDPGRWPQAGLARLSCRCRSSPLAARWSTATKPLTETRSGLANSDRGLWTVRHVA